MKKIYVYADYGCERIETLLEVMESYFTSKNIQIELTDAERIRNGALAHEMPAALVIGGGAANPYSIKLGAEGMQKIRDFVTAGGTYLGICAGGYFGASDIVFEEGTEVEVVNKGLALVNCRCIGTLKPFVNRMVAEGALSKDLDIICNYDSTIASGSMLKCLWLSTGEEFSAYYNGGGYFSDGDFETLAAFKTITEDNKTISLPVIIQKKVGGGLVLLSGVHIEKRPEDLIWGKPRNSPEWKRRSLFAEEIKANKVDVFKKLLELFNNFRAL